MMFWIEKRIKISYNQLLEDLNNDKPISELSGYIYFLKLLKNLSKGQVISSIENLNNYLIKKKDVLSFEILTSGTTSVSKKLRWKYQIVLGMLKQKTWGVCGNHSIHTLVPKFFFNL